MKAYKGPDDCSESMLFLPKSKGRRGEGGLRKMGYFKKSSQEKPLLTIITVVQNRKIDLEHTILSIIGQAYDNVELIIIDGGSTDGTINILYKYEHAIDYWVSEKDKGIYDAMNKGIDLALGVWVMFINAGDKILFLDKKSLLGSSSSKTCFFYSEQRGKISRSPLTKLYLTRNTPCHQSVQYLRTELCKFNTNFGIEADYEQMTRVVKSACVANYSESLTYFDVAGASASVIKKWSEKSLNRILIVKKNLGIFFALIAVFHAIRIGVKNLFFRK